jgi:hypothetical protein
MFDYPTFGEDIIYKLRSAQICPNCIKKIAQNAQNKGEALAYMMGLKDAMEEIRHKLFDVDLVSYFGKTNYQLVIKEDLSLVVNTEEEEIPLPIGKGRETSIFMMLLKYQHGLTYEDFKEPRFLEEYLELYHKYYVNNASKESLLRQSKGEIEKGTFKSNLQSTISKMKARLNNAFVFYPEINRQLQIKSGKKGLIVPIERKYLVNLNPDFPLDLIA